VNWQTAKVTSTRKALYKKFFSPRIFRGVGDVFVTLFFTSDRGKTKSGVAKKAVGMFKNAQKKIQTR